jgi:hypothetical protein
MTEEIDNTPKVDVEVPVTTFESEAAKDVAQEEVVESTEEVVVEEKKDDLSAQFAELKRRERELRVNQKKQAGSIEAQKAEWIETIKKDPLAALASYGISADNIADAILGVEKQEEAKPELSPEYQEIKDRLDKRDADEKAAEQTKMVNKYKSEVFDFVEKDQGAYEILLNHPEGKDLYWNSILNFYQSAGEAPSDVELKAIAGKVEEHLYNKSKELLSLSKFAPKKEAVEESVKAEQAVEEKPFKTLSKNMTARSAPKVNLIEKGNAYSVKTSYASYMEEQKAKLFAKLNSQ